MITDDMEKMQEILGGVFSQLAEDYMLSAKEAENIADKLKRNTFCRYTEGYVSIQ